MRRKVAARGEVVAFSAMKRGAVVPHDVVAGAPRMRIDERRLGGMLEQLRDQQASLRDAQIADAVDVHARVEHLAPRARMHMDERALHRREALELLLGVAIVAERNAGMESRVAAGPAFDVALGFLGQRVPGCAQVGPLGLAALLGDDHRREHRILDRDILEGAVGVPELVGEHADEFGVFAAGDGPVEGHVADVDQLFILEPRGRSGGLAQARVQRSELPGAGNLLGLVQRLAAENQHCVPVHGRIDCADRLRVERFSEIHPAGFRGKQRMQRFECECHGYPS